MPDSTSDTDSSETAPAPTSEKRDTSKVIRAAILGTIVEYYDFSIYGYMATLLSIQFFVSDDPNAALLETFGAFAVAFFLRIPGGIFFGHIGDKYGRKRALMWTILLMAASTVAIGLLPTYATLGLWATSLLILCRCLQGFSAGGELGGANVFVSEYAPPRHRGLQTALVMSGAYFGAIFASLAALGVNRFFEADEVEAWAWRIPFLISAVIGFLGFYIRNKLHDSPEFEKLESAKEVKKLPIGTLLRTSKGSIVKLVMLYAVSAAGYYISSVYVAAHLQRYENYSATVSFVSTCIALMVGVVIVPLAGAAADRWGRRPVLLVGSGAGTLLVVPMFMLMQTGSIPLAVLAQTVCFGCVSIVNGALFVTFAEYLATDVRYSGAALVTNIAQTLLGGTAPMIATYLVSTTGNSISPAFLYAACGVITFWGALIIRETRGISLDPVSDDATAGR